MSQSDQKPRHPELSLDAILSFLRDTRGIVNWGAKDLRDCLALDSKQTHQVLTLLAMQGYIEKEGEKWLTTVAGEMMSESKKPQCSLGSVTRVLDTLKERIEAVNRDKQNEFSVTKAVAYGDFLAGSSQVQAADVGIELSRRDLISGPDGLDKERKTFLVDLRRQSRLVSLHLYQTWMSQRSHRNLL